MKAYFFENLTTGETLETDNRLVAFQVYNACMFPAELWHNGNVIADQEFSEDELTGEVILLSQLWPTTKNDLEYCEL